MASNQQLHSANLTAAAEDMAKFAAPCNITQKLLKQDIKHSTKERKEVVA
jgi:hypothetical protein